MTVTSTHPNSTDIALSGSADGERTQRVHMADRDRNSLQRLSALPLWALIGIETGWALVLLTAAILEQPLVASVLARVLPAAPDWQIHIGSAAYLVVYAVLWYGLGHRVAEARHLSLSSTSAGTAKKLNPAFGAIGVALLAVLTAALVGVSVRRALSLAERAGQSAVTTLATGSVTPPTPAELFAASDSAWRHAFWPDLIFTLTLMLLLAALATWHGYRSEPRHRALSLHLVQRRADTSLAQAADLQAHAETAARRADSQNAAAADRDSQAEQFDASLLERFEQAKTTVRHAMSYQQGRPEATTALATHNSPDPARTPLRIVPDPTGASAGTN